MYDADARTRAFGALRVHSWGGSTWLSEFALLTGLSHFDFGPTGEGVYYTIVGHVRPSLPRLLKAQGYRSIAISGVPKGLYNMETAQRQLGFDEVLNPLDFPEWGGKSLADHLISDEELGRYADQIIARSSDRPLFLFVLSMMQHGPYDSAHPVGYGLDSELRGILQKLHAQTLSPVVPQGPPEPATLERPITWLFEPDTFEPLARLQGDRRESIVCDHLGTPLAMFDAAGTQTWSLDLDIYCQVRELGGTREACPFRFPGQYEDTETGLYYNRFRYYDPEAGGYICQDPIGLAGGNPTLYGYVRDPMVWVDKLGLKGCTVKPPDGPDHDMILEVERKVYPETAKHIEDSIAKGKPRIVTVNRGGADLNRAESLKGIATKSGADRDEWPMAMFKEGGKGADIRHIDPSDNRGAGSSIAKALKGAPDGSRVKFIFI
jgi:RHS repeat-associated protein